MSLTRIDENLANYDFFDSLCEAESSFMEWSTLLSAYFFYACTSDGHKESIIRPYDEPIYKNQKAVFPENISDGHIIDLSMFHIVPDELLRMLSHDGEWGLEIRPRLGIGLAPFYLFENIDEDILTTDNVTLFRIKDSGDRADCEHEDARIPDSSCLEIIPVRAGDNKAPLGALASEIVVKPEIYQLMVDALASVVSYRLSVFQPILAGCGIGCILLPKSDGAVWFPNGGSFSLSENDIDRESLPSVNDVLPITRNYIFDVRSKFDVLFDELERRKAQKLITIETHESNGNGVETLTIDRTNREVDHEVTVQAQNKGSSPRWSKIMSKKKAAATLKWSVRTLDNHIAQNPGIIKMARSRQTWRFDCNDDSFGSLPVDEIYNKNIK